MFGIYDGTKVIAKFISPLTVKSNSPIFASDALSLKRTVTKRSAQRWEITAGLEPLSYGANALFTMLVTKGQSEAFNIVMPQNYGAQLLNTSTSSPAATGSLGASSVSVTGNVGVIPTGTFIKFANHSKVYMLTQDLSNTGTMYIYPNLLVAVAGVGFTHKGDVLMSCLFNSDTVTGMVYTDGILMDMGTVTLVERL
jgi:hypothetical protein